ncbi:hypothetical protein B0T17DRAFT_519434 [Bombardia bombarda]|uniref:Uncharacterized protein n=1 Tax=Bombardia bombarda TaxID=252184 RepID=A0AA40CF77_9PEZI|nr:hypothetical protein B0T17DRAFT_519434 [Bombardia bombarda]
MLRPSRYPRGGARVSSRASTSPVQPANEVKPPKEEKLGPTAPLILARYPGVLCFDMGSTSSRMACYRTMMNLLFHILHPDRRDGPHRVGFDEVDFPSTGYPFEPTQPLVERYLLRGVDPERRGISNKYGVWVIANPNEEDAIVDGYAPIEPLRALVRDKDPEIIMNIVRAVHDQLIAMKRAAFHQMSRNQTTIEVLVFTIPAQWDLAFEAKLRELAAPVFNIPRNMIMFITEPEAVAHYTLRRWREEMENRGYGDRDTILFMDFGGHNMNGCLFYVARHQQDPDNMRFFRLSEPFGVGGGSATWQYYFEEEIIAKCRQVTNEPLPPAEHQRMQGMFREFKKYTNLDNNFPFSWISDDQAHFVQITAQKIKEFFESALTGPLNLAKNEIDQLAEMKARWQQEGEDMNPLVVVSGGTGRNHIIKARIRQMCQDASLPEPFFTHDFESGNDGIRIAVGGALAVAEGIDPERFLDLGAAIGVHAKEIPSGFFSSEIQWPKYACYLARKDHHIVVSVKTSGRDHVQLLCDPYWTASSQDDRDENRVLHSRSYELLDLGLLERGKWTFDLSFSQEDTSTMMSMALTRVYGRKRYIFGPVMLSLYFDYGANCMFLGCRNGTVEDIGLPIDVRKPPTRPTEPAAQPSQSEDIDMDSADAWANGVDVVDDDMKEEASRASVHRTAEEYKKDLDDFLAGEDNEDDQDYEYELCSGDEMDLDN